MIVIAINMPCAMRHILALPPLTPDAGFRISVTCIFDISWCHIAMLGAVCCYKTNQANPAELAPISSDDRFSLQRGSAVPAMYTHTHYLG